MSSRLAAASLSLVSALSLIPALAAAQGSDWEQRCRRWNGDSDREVVCEERETRIGARGELRVDGRANGGVSVKSWEGSDILVRAQIQASAPDRDEAREIAGDIRVHTSGSTIYAEGPDVGRRRSWSVSYEIFVPRRMNLDLETTTGPSR